MGAYESANYGRRMCFLVEEHVSSWHTATMTTAKLKGGAGFD